MNPHHNLSLGIYVLTFNTPKQFELWCKLFYANQKLVFETCSKYVINNTTEKEVIDKYVSLFDEYNFSVIHSGKNLGINGGRHFAAQHFNKSDDEYMIFFEDDMLLHEDNCVVCDSGFYRYHTELVVTSKIILEEEKLDYLKLNFTEVYGHNHHNWAQYINEFYKLEGETETYKKNVIISHTGSINKLPYSIGNYHYCNWPILFTKRGNFSIFIKQELKNKFEHIWMFMAHRLLQKKVLKAGCLLLSPINHLREYSYGKYLRQEDNSKHK